jgi:hypothetical protein
MKAMSPDPDLHHLCVQRWGPPPNDDCSGAIDLGVNSSCIPTTGDERRHRVHSSDHMQRLHRHCERRRVVQVHRQLHRRHHRGRWQPGFDAVGICAMVPARHRYRLAELTSMEERKRINVTVSPEGAVYVCV